MPKKRDKLIILDFDHTMFNTTKFVAALKKKFQDDFGIDEKTFDEKREYIKTCNNVIDIDTFVKHIPHDDKAALHTTITHLLQNCADKWIFDDVRDFMKRHQDRFDVAVVTHGDQELQSSKIHNSKLPGDFHTVISTQSKDQVVANFIDQYEAIHFIDDKARNIQDVKMAYPEVITYFISRPEDNPYEGACPTCQGADMAIGGLQELALA